MNAHSFKQPKAAASNGSYSRLAPAIGAGAQPGIGAGAQPGSDNVTEQIPSVVRSVHARIPTAEGEFQLYHYSNDYDGKEHLAIVMGEIGDGAPTLVRVHSECFTGDVLGSRRCDCGEQLHRAMAMIAAAGRGVIIYLRQEGRGIGLAEKLRAYNLQDLGYDTVEANLLLGHQADEREYWAAAAILADLHVDSIHLMTNNPDKIEHLRALGINVASRVPVIAEVHADNRQYLQTKAQRMRHMLDLPAHPDSVFPEPVAEELTALQSAIAQHAGPLPYITLTYAQFLDGAIAGRNREQLAISGRESKRMTHALRTLHDAILVGVGTAIADDPKLTARLFTDPEMDGLHPDQPQPVVLDSDLRLSLDARLFAHPRPLILAARADVDPVRVAQAQARGAEVLLLPVDSGGALDLQALLQALGARGIHSLMVEGGAQVIASFLAAQVADRVIVTIAPQFSGGLRVQVAEAQPLANVRFTPLGEDVILWAAPAAAAVAVA